MLTEAAVPPLRCSTANLWGEFLLFQVFHAVFLVGSLLFHLFQFLTGVAPCFLSSLTTAYWHGFASC